MSWGLIAARSRRCPGLQVKEEAPADIGPARPGRMSSPRSGGLDARARVLCNLGARLRQNVVATGHQVADGPGR